MLANLLDENSSEDPLVDLVVFDEAHYMRNPESAAHTLGEMLREVSHHRVLLSATPINLANDDLYYLLRLCDPDHFQYPSSFKEMLEANRPLVLARDAALRRNSEAEEIITHVRGAAASDLLRQSRQLATIIDEPPTAGGGALGFNTLDHHAIMQGTDFHVVVSYSVQHRANLPD